MKNWMDILKEVGLFLLTYIVPYAAYYLGILIRRKVWPSKGLSLKQQLLISIPLVIAIVTPLIAVVEMILKTNIDKPLIPYLTTIGIIIEHGIVINENAAKLIERLREKRTSPT